MTPPLLEIEYHSGIPVYRQIINAITSAVVTGSLNAGDALPTIRDLAAELNVNPNTVAKAYREMELTGVVASAGRNGTVVTASPGRLPRPTRDERERKLKEIYSRAVAEAKAHRISDKELAEMFRQGE